jgi:hypothetical protein
MVLRASVAVFVFALPLYAENRLHIPAQTVPAGAQDVSIPILLDACQALYGLSLSLRSDSELLTLERVELAGSVIEDADFSSGRVIESGARLSWGIVMDVSEPFDIEKVVPAGRDATVGHLIVDVAPGVNGTANILFENIPSDLFAIPPDPGAKNLLLIEDGQGVEFTHQAGIITVQPSGVGPFRRGDCNQDGEATGTPTDAIFLLNFLFAGSVELLCRAACDFNGDGLLDATPTDVVFYLNFNFLGGEPMLPPLESCGISSRLEDGGLGCETPTACSTP